MRVPTFFHSDIHLWVYVEDLRIGRKIAENCGRTKWDLEVHDHFFVCSPEVY
jgi:hypothetical protein